MRYIITENQSNQFLLDFFKRRNITYNILYLSDNGYDSITATVYLYKNGEVYGYNRGYEFFFKYDSRFNSLTLEGRYPRIENNKILTMIPSEIIIDFFTDEVKTYLKKFIDNGYSTLRRK